MKSSLQFLGTCVGLPVELLQAFDDAAHDIDYKRFVRCVGLEVIRQLERQLGYAGSPLHLRNDPCVSYTKGRVAESPAVCMHHSRIHHIWTY